MDQYSNLNVHGKLASKNAIKLENGPDNTGVQGTDPNDVVIVSTLNTTAAGKADVDLENIEIYGTRENEKTIVWDATNSRWQYGEAGKVDDVKIGTDSIVENKIATIPAATSSSLGVIQVGSGLSVDNGSVSQAPVTRNDGSDTATISAGGSFAALSNVSSSTTGHVTGQTVKTFTLPSTYPPSSHTHGNITNDGKIGQTAGKPILTSTNGVLIAGSVTAPIAISNSSIIHDTSGVVSSGTLSKGSASKSVSVTVNQWGHVTSLSDQDIAISESQVTNLTTDLSTITGNISTINGKIPSQASSSNQLADKDFVNSSIASGTATFRGTFNALELNLPGATTTAEKQAIIDDWSGSDDTAAQTLVAGLIPGVIPAGTTLTNSDYVFIAVDQTPTGDAGEDWFWRFKYVKPSTAAGTWAYEYTLNNSSFTDVQWKTINSLVTNTTANPNDPTETPYRGVDVKDILEHIEDTVIHVTASDKTTWNGKQNAITGAASTITSNNLDANRVLISNSNGKVAAATITTTELGYLDNVTEDIQDQLDTKFDTIDQSSSGNYVSSVAVDGSDPTTIKVTRATLPTLSGGQAATAGKYVSGVTVSGHTVTVSQENLPTLSGGAAAASGKYVSGVTVSGHAVTVAQENLPTLSKGTTSGSGNVVTDLSVSGHTVTLTKGITALTSHQTITQDGITGATINRYGVCDTATNTAAKTVSITSGTFPTLDANANGTRITVNFTHQNTAQTPTLNVNNKGAKNIYIDGTQITTRKHTLLVGMCDFVYDNSTGWHLQRCTDVAQWPSSDVNSDLPLLLSSGAKNVGTQVGFTGVTYRDPGIYANPSTNSITATTFNGALNGNASTATNVAYSGITNNPFSATDVTLADM